MDEIIKIAIFVFASYHIIRHLKLGQLRKNIEDNLQKIDMDKIHDPQEIIRRTIAKKDIPTIIPTHTTVHEKNFPEPFSEDKWRARLFITLLLVGGCLIYLSI